MKNFIKKIAIISSFVFVFSTGEICFASPSSVTVRVRTSFYNYCGELLEVIITPKNMEEKSWQSDTMEIQDAVRYPGFLDSFDGKCSDIDKLIEMTSKNNSEEIDKMLNNRHDCMEIFLKSHFEWIPMDNKMVFSKRKYPQAFEEIIKIYNNIGKFHNEEDKTTDKRGLFHSITYALVHDFAEWAKRL